MSVVKQTKMRLELNPAKPWEETVVKVHYDNSGAGRYAHEPEGGRFYVKLPPIVADALGQTEARGETHQVAFWAFEACLKRFRNLKTEVNRVILYEIILRPNPEAENRSSWDAGYKVDIWAGTYEETAAVSGNDMRRHHYEKMESSLSYPGEASHINRSDGDKWEDQVPWTEKNEAFFKWVEISMNQLVTALGEIKSPEKLIETINSGKLLPLGRQ